MKRPMLRRAALTALVTLACWPAASFADKACEASWAKVDKCVPGRDGACKLPLPANDDAQALRYAIGFDFLRDGCLPSAGVSVEGQPNGGIKLGGTTDGHCAWKNQLEFSNTYYRAKCVVWTPPGESSSSNYCAHMYALYFVKDQTGDGCIVGPACGHRNDWEFGMVWTKDDVLTHATTSAHGGTETKGIAKVRHEGDKVLMVYRKKSSTHFMSFASSGEKPVNPSCNWFTPPIVTWDLMRGNGKADNSYLKGVLNTEDYGRAITPFNDNNFVGNIRKSLPASFPPAKLW
jgi:hypothetical protein